MEASMHDNVITLCPPSSKGAARPAGSAVHAATERHAATIVRFSSPEKLRRGQEIMRSISEKQHMAALGGGVSADISLNESLRRGRDIAWDRADASVRFLRAQLEYYRTVASGQKYGVPDARGLPTLDAAADFQLVESYRTAVLEQLLTPAPKVAALIWKRRKVAALGPYDWVEGVTTARVEKAIADDEAFLRAFPARHSPNRPK
jgi:hypothetical protein